MKLTSYSFEGQYIVFCGVATSISQEPCKVAIKIATISSMEISYDNTVFSNDEYTHTNEYLQIGLVNGDSRKIYGPQINEIFQNLIRF